MKKISNKKLLLASTTVRVLDGDQLDGVGGAGGAVPTTTIYRRTAISNETIACRRGTVRANATARCILPPG